MKKEGNYLGGVYIPTTEEKKRFKQEYPAGAIVVLDSMEDEPNTPMKPGLKGVITRIDDALGIHVNWENGSSLALIYGVDECHLE